MEQVSIMEISDAREQRFYRQQEFLKLGKPLVSVTMNIAGPVKRTPLIDRGFLYGDFLVREALRGLPILKRAFVDPKTGMESLYAVDSDPLEIKRRMARLEELPDLGRLMDLDVIRPDGSKVDREELGLEPRKCLLCNGPARICARSRAHTVAQLQAETTRRLTAFFREKDRDTLAAHAVRSLLYEVLTTPKPGLVDRENSGSHGDMDIFTFADSSSVLYPYFYECARLGQEISDPKELFSALRPVGMEAEARMFRATRGVNTHKGAIFSLGLLVAATAGVEREAWKNSTDLCTRCGEMTQGLTEKELASVKIPRTKGEEMYLRYGEAGIRGQAEGGFPAVRNVGLPLLETRLSQGESWNSAGRTALLALLSAQVDSNLLARGDKKTQEWAAQLAQDLLEREPHPSTESLHRLNTLYVEKNLSPGGTADLLALCYFLHFIKEETL